MAGEANVSSVQSTVNPWSTNFDPGAGLPGGSIAIDDIIGGAWYALNGDANGVAGDDLKVLIGQFTTTGELSGQVYCQVFISGDGMNEFRDTFFFGANDMDGCTDITACNFNAEATNDDGSCTFAEDGYDCDGNCLADADGDGVCDEFEVAGCTDTTACNYSADATDDDGSCTFAEAGYDCDGNCLNDADGDGVCDEFEIAGCTDITACNYSGTPPMTMGPANSPPAPAVSMLRHATTTTPPPSTTVLAPIQMPDWTATATAAEPMGMAFVTATKSVDVRTTPPATTTTPPPTMMGPAPMRMLVTIATVTASAMPTRTAFATRLTRVTIPT